MMTFEVFQKIVQQETKEYLPPVYHDAEYNIFTAHMHHNGMPYTALAVRRKDRKPTELVNLDTCYEALKFGDSLESVLELIAETVRMLEEDDDD